MGNGCLKPATKNSSQVYVKLKNIEMILLEEEGLDNVGNSCYINSVLQSLVMFDKVLSNTNNKKPISNAMRHILRKLKNKQANKCNTNITQIKQVIILILNILETSWRDL
jgi:uncharacterized UBP type Zn finger protein